jgi:hypothetical protein
MARDARKEEMIALKIIQKFNCGLSPIKSRNRTYPLTVDVYIVTARPLSENAQKLRDWFLSSDGQQLIEDVGYIPITPPAASADLATPQRRKNLP